MIIYAVHGECHGIIGYYAYESTARKVCEINAEGYDIDPKTTELDYDGEKWWGWWCSYVEKIEVIE
jgi:hypothetical protein